MALQIQTSFGFPSTFSSTFYRAQPHRPLAKWPSELEANDRSARPFRKYPRRPVLSATGSGTGAVLFLSALYGLALLLLVCSLLNGAVVRLLGAYPHDGRVDVLTYGLD